MTLCLDLSEWKFARSGALNWLASRLDLILGHHAALTNWERVVILVDPARPLDAGSAAQVMPLPPCVGRRPWRDLREALLEATGSEGLILLQGDSLWLDSSSLAFATAARDGGKRGGLFSRQPGHEFLYFRDAEALREIPDQVTTPFFYAKSKLAAASEWAGERSQPAGLAFLKLSEATGRDAFAEAIAGTIDPADVGESDYEWFKVANLSHLRSVIARIDQFRPLENLRVLEIAASTEQSTIPRLLLDEYGVQSYVGVNIEPFVYDAPSDQVKLVCSDIHKVDFEAGAFDLVFSIAAWEHLPDPGAIFAKVSTWLAGGGIHYGIFYGWSGPKGHHLISRLPLADRTPDYAQFLHNRASLEQYFASLAGVDAATAANAAARVFEGNYINRAHSTDFLRWIEASGLETLYLDGRSNGRFIRGSKEAAEKSGRSRAEHSAQGLEFVLRKSDYHLAHLLRKPVDPPLARLRSMVRRVLARLSGRSGRR